MNKRGCGILLPISSLPSKYGIGCFSQEAYDFVDRLANAGQKFWQILPLGPTGYGDSPYQSFSTFAGNPYFISLEWLMGDGVLTRKECDAADFGSDASAVDYEKMYDARYLLLYKAYERSHISANPEFQKFCREQADWLDDYALFMAVKENVFDGKPWDMWERSIRFRCPESLAFYAESLAAQIEYQKYMQFQFYRQWRDLKSYANRRGIQIIGDLPIYVSMDSADIWANPKLFQLDGGYRPTRVAGCPPDAFSATGQLWGNPLYDWEMHKKTGYAWWLKRISHCFELYDVLRIDHFRGFDEYYAIPYGDKTAENGRWEKGPGMDLFRAISAQPGVGEIIAEDLGFITDSVRQLVRDSGYPNMRVLEFAFDERDTGSASDYLPHNYPRNCVVYTGTHDNETLVSWFQNITEGERQMARTYLQDFVTPDGEIYQKFITLALASVADICIIPMQDYLGLDDRARMNHPSTLGTNWKWRMESDAFSGELQGKMRTLARIYGR